MTEPVNAQRGLRIEASDERFLAALDAAVDYRGDVTLISQRDDAVEGYVFDLAHRGDAERAVVRFYPKEGEPRSIALRDLAAIEFTGRDTAEGKSFETWVKKYVEKKRAGEKASIESEPLE